MAAFRKIFPLALLVLVLGLATTASAQTPFTCTASTGTATPLLRSEGYTELTGDIVLNCSGGVPIAASTTIPAANITVFFNTQVTSRLLSSSTRASEALLMVDEPATADQRLCDAGTQCNVTGTAVGSPLAEPTSPFKGGAASIFQGVAEGSQIRFTAVPIAPSGTVNRTYRITNIRVNAQGVPAGSFGPSPVTALISVTPITAGATVSLPNSSVTIGFVTSGLTFSVRGYGASSPSLGSINLKQCNGIGTSSTPGGWVNARFREGFATSFKPRTATTSVDNSPAPLAQNVPGLIYNSESGFYAPALQNVANQSVGSVIGLADFGTRLRAVFNNIPAGVTVYVTTRNFVNTSATSAPTETARLILFENQAYFAVTPTTTFTYGTSPNVIDSGWAPVTLDATTRSGTAVWEVLTAEPALIQNYDFGVLLYAPPSVTSNLPAPGTGSVTGSFAPAPPAIGSSPGVAQTSAYPIPRFIETGTAVTIMNISLCRSILLFPYVVNLEGYDTGLSIANTSKDPSLGANAHAGTCTLYFYGNIEVPNYTTPTAIEGGKLYLDVLSNRAAGFQGYMIAVCNFQYAHGFAYITDVGGRNLAQGYLALVMPDGGRSSAAATSGVSLAGGTGELLGN